MKIFAGTKTKLYQFHKGKKYILAPIICLMDFALSNR